MMFKRLFFGLFLMLVATPAMAQESAASFAGRLQEFVGKPLAGTIILSAARAEGNVLIITLDAPNWEGDDRTKVPALFLTGFCEGGDAGYFSVNRMRIDTLEGGRNLMTGAVIEKCPPEEAASN